MQQGESAPTLGEGGECGRVTCAAVAALGVVCLLGVARLVPDMPKPQGVRLRHEMAAFRDVQVLLAMAMTVQGFGGVFAAITYMLYVPLGALAAVLALFTLTAHDKVAAAMTITLVGSLGFAVVPPLQKRVLDQAQGAPTLASAVNIGAFNLGNALAAWLGGLVIHTGFGYTAPNWVGAALAVSALGLAFLSAALERKRNVPSTVVVGGAVADRRTAVHR
ncbi:hypothetical protein ACFZCL_22560 [Streptomyces sp. NPDC008159]|uniref:hypothetical protein n=1 Tax=Streptomyces sp. NPDC008159 TaxID=3364817 RepID=UPI0036E4899A